MMNCHDIPNETYHESFMVSTHWNDVRGDGLRHDCFRQKTTTSAGKNDG